jgi:signal transduction histidine kinase
MGDTYLLLILAGLLVLLAAAVWKLRTQSDAITRQRAELLQLQSELLEIKRQWEAVTEEKVKLMSLLSHDLKGPFNRIFALVQLMNFSADNLTPDQREYISKIHQMATDGMGMIRNLLDARKLETRAVEFKPESIELDAFLHQLVKTQQAVAEKKSITLSVEPGDKLAVIGDRQLLQRTFENLLSNAIKFSPMPSAVKVGYVRKAGRIETWVVDEGPGITPEDQPRLFKKFQALSNRPTGGESATGLGLSLAKAMVEKMGGTVRYEPGPSGRGSCFVVSMPA